MSKRLPYYQSEPAEYLAGDIMFCSYAAQGVFSVVRALYWQKDCKLTLTQVKRRLNGADEFIEELIDENIIKIEGDNICISFLDEQFEKAIGKSKTNSENGKKGAAKRWANKGVNSESIATPLENDSESIALREDKEDKEDKEDNISHVRFLINDYPTKFEQMRMKLRGIDEKEFFNFLNAKCELEDIPKEFKKINARFNLLLSNWSKTKETPQTINLSKI